MLQRDIIHDQVGRIFIVLGIFFHLDEEEWIISGAVIFSLTVLIVGAVFLVRSNTCRQVLINIRLFQLRYSENQEQVTQSLATEDELSREALA